MNTTFEHHSPHTGQKTTFCEFFTSLVEGLYVDWTQEEVRALEAYLQGRSAQTEQAIEKWTFWKWQQGTSVFYKGEIAHGEYIASTVDCLVEKIRLHYERMDTWRERMKEAGIRL